MYGQDCMAELPLPSGGRSMEKMLPALVPPSLLQLGSEHWPCLLLAPLTVLGSSKGMSGSDAALALALLHSSSNQGNEVILFLPIFPPPRKTVISQQSHAGLVYHQNDTTATGTSKNSCALLGTATKIYPSTLQQLGAVTATRYLFC